MAMEDAAGAPATQAELNVVQNDLTLLRNEVRSGFELIRIELKNTKRDLILEIIKTNLRIDLLRADFIRDMKLLCSTIVKKLDDAQTEIDNVDRAQVIADWLKSRPT